MARGTEGLLDRALCVVGAVLFSQAPEFFQQYLQRLGGALDEARRQLSQFEATARQSGLTLAQLIDRTHHNADVAVAKLGDVMTATVERVQSLQVAHDAILRASLWTRPFVFLQHVEPDIARGTWIVFKPAVPTTFEGLVYAGVGMLVLIALYHGVAKPTGRFAVRRARSLRRAIDVAPPPPAPKAST